MSNEPPHSPMQNRILAALPTNDYARLQDDLEVVNLKLGQVLFEPGDNPAYVYFPATCIVSLIFTTRKGASAELAITGNDGLVGVPLVLGGNTTTHRAVIQSEGTAYRLKIEIMRWELDQSGELQQLALRYTQALMTQMAQSVVCNRHHSVDQQLCRWLLLSLDRLPGNQLNMTQELIGHMLGVRREAVTEAAGKLQAAGLIHYSRGKIVITNRAGLEERVCECYGVVKSEYDRLFQLPPACRPKSRARPNPETLRKRAEARLQQSPTESTMSHWDNIQLIHELQVHQIELEMHNEELRHAYEEADALIERYADIYDFAPISYFTLDRQGVIVDMNLAGSILLGIKSSQKGRHRFASRISPHDLPDFDQFFAAVFEAKDKSVGEFVLSGSTHHPESIVKIEAVPDENGDECRMVVMDITAIKKAEKALQEREQYLRAVIDNFPFLVWLKDSEGRYLAVNRAFTKHCDALSDDVLIGQRDINIPCPTIAAIDQVDDSSIIESGEQKSVVASIAFNDQEHWYEIYKSPVTLTGQPIGLVGFARDITAKHNIQLALKNSEMQYRHAIEKMPLSIAVLQKGMLKYLNPKGAELLGYPPDECTNVPYLPFVYEADRQWATNAYREYRLGKAIPDDVEIRLQGKSGQAFECLMHVSQTEWEGGPATLAIFEDVTEKKRLDAELRRLASMDPLTELANSSHFFNHLDQALSALKRNSVGKVALLILEIDNFKTTAADLGQLGESAVLRLVSAVLREEMRKVDFAGRIAHEKFAMLLPDTDMDAAWVFAERLNNKMRGTSLAIGGKQAGLTLSIGIAPVSASDATSNQGYALAERALIKTKLSGGNQSIRANCSDMELADVKLP